MQFTLTCRDEDGTKTQKKFESMFLDDVVQQTGDFLRGVGFVFDEIQTYSTEEETYAEKSAEREKEFLSESGHSPYDVVSFSHTSD